jgi:hypothetical protein
LTTPRAKVDPRPVRSELPIDVQDPAPPAGPLFPLGLDHVYYLVNYSHKHAYMYVETPKVSCSTVKRVLQLLEVGWDAALVPQNVHDRTASPLPKLWQESGPLEELFRGPKFFRFSFVRNPYTRVISAYSDKIVDNAWERARLLPALGLENKPNVSLLEFLTAVRSQPNEKRDIHWMPQSTLLQTQTIRYDFIGRFETFGAGFQRVLERIAPGSWQRAKGVRVDTHRTNAKKKVAQLLGPEERDLVLEIYGDDFKQFSYSADPQFADL